MTFLYSRGACAEVLSTSPSLSQAEEHLLALLHSQPLRIPRWERAVRGPVPEDAVLVEPRDSGGSAVGVVDNEVLRVAAAGGVQLHQE